MDWMYYNPNAVGIGSLGHYMGDKFELNLEAANTLENINERLMNEDKTLRTFRRSIGFNQIMQKDLAPILIELKKENMEIFFSAVRVFVNFTTPLECLFSPEELSQTEEGQQTLFELQQHLSEAKSIFLDQRISRNIMEMMDFGLEQIQEKLKKSEGNSKVQRNSEENGDKVDVKHDEVVKVCRGIGLCITLLRNILHISDETPSGSSSPSSSSSNQKGTITSRQNQILWNLFSGNLDTVIIRLIGSSCLSHWCTSLMQLIALVYKDQHVHNLQRLLAQWLETELSESSEDNESNTSPQDQNGSCSSPVLTSIETDDSSDSNGNVNSDKEESCHADASSTDSGNVSKPEQFEELAKSTSEQKTVAKEEKLQNVDDPVKDVDMHSDTSETSLTKEPPCKKMALMETLPCKANVTFSSSSQSNKISDPAVTSSSMVTQISITGRSKRKATSPPTSVEDSSSSSNPNLNFEQNSNRKIAKPRKESKAMKENYQQQVDLINAKNPSTKTNKKDSDCSDNIRTTSNSGTSDYGYGSGRTLENVSYTSSNDDDHERKGRDVAKHTSLQKPRPKKPSISAAEKREIKRKILIKRAKSQRLKAKALLHHSPTYDDIADLLKEFTVDFLLKGYSRLVKDLREALLSDINLQMDKSHFLWLVTYFLKFASQLEVDMEQIGDAMSISTISYLVYEGVRLYEEFELACRERTVDLKPHLRRLHLVITAIHEFTQTLSTYLEFSHFSSADQKRLRQLQQGFCEVKEFRQLYLLLIRRFNPTVQSRQYLKDLVAGNHSLLIMIEKYNGDANFLSNHIKQFATVEVMRSYGLLLETFPTNSSTINDAIFTMMHHISGDLQRPEVLFIPQILKAFSDMWEKEEIEICEDWADLIEYVIQKFIATMNSRPHACASTLLGGLDNSDSQAENGFSKKQLDDLYFFFSQSEHSEDPVGRIIEMYKAAYSVTKTRLSVIQALLSQGVITHAQYMGLMYMKSVLLCKPYHEGSVVAEAGSERCDSECHETDFDHNDGDRPLHPKGQRRRDQVELLKELLKKQGKEYLITWLQHILLETCQVKLNGDSLVTSNETIQEPCTFFYNYVHQSIPLVPWNKQQESGLQSETFILLLHNLGFHLAADVGKCFPRIPHFWSADHILHLAEKLGPINPEELKFDISMLVSNAESESSSISRSNSPNSNIEESSLDQVKLENNIIKDVTASVESPSFSLFPQMSKHSQNFAMPTPTHNWIQMAMLSKKMVSNLASSGATQPMALSQAVANKVRKITKTTQATSTVSSIINVSRSSENLLTLDEEKEEENSYSFEKMHISDEPDDSE